MQQQHTMKMGWGRLAAMIATSTVIMFFLMFQLVYSLARQFQIARGACCSVPRDAARNS